jgi:hypothetical protein
MNLTHRAKLHSLEHVRIGSEADSLHSTNFMSALSPITSRSFAFSLVIVVVAKKAHGTRHDGWSSTSPEI